MIYKILRSLSISSLERNVNEKLREGYKPIGGVSFDEVNKKYMQAILKDKNE